MCAHLVSMPAPLQQPTRVADPPSGSFSSLGPCQFHLLFCHQLCAPSALKAPSLLTAEELRWDWKTLAGPGAGSPQDMASGCPSTGQAAWKSLLAHWQLLQRSEMRVVSCQALALEFWTCSLRSVCLGSRDLSGDPPAGGPLP